MEVSKLFHFQSTFFSDAVSDTFSAEENVSVTFNLRCNFHRLLIDAVKSFLHVAGKHFQLVDHLGSHVFGSVEIFVLSEPNGNECEDGDLANESFSTS